MDWTLLRPFIAGQVTHIFSLAGGWFVAHGALAKADEGSFVNIMTGIGMWAIAAAWDWWQKDGQKKMLATLAKMKPVASSGASTNDAAKAAITAVKAGVQ